MKVDLDKILDALEMVNEDLQAYYNLDTGEIEWLGEFMSAGKNEETADKIELGNYISLPSKFDINEYSIMEDFIYSLTDGEIRNKLYNAIKGKGAFRRFKDSVNYLGIDKEWYSFRGDAYKNIALEWCKEYGLEVRGEINAV